MAERLHYLENTEEKLTAAIAPLVAGTKSWRKPRRPAPQSPTNNSRPTTRPAITLAKYREMLEFLVKPESTKESTLWSAQIAALRRKQRAYGNDADLTAWANERGFRQAEAAMPESTV